jgi:hypothetical protein
MRPRALLPAVAAPIAFFGASIIGGRRVRDYRHRDEPMSALAASGCEGAPAMVPGFIALAASTWVLGGALSGSRLPKSIGPWMRVTGAGILVAGLARQSDRSCPVRFNGDENVTISDDLHVLSAMVVFGSWIAMPLFVAARGRELPSRQRRASLALGLAALAGQTGTGALMSRNAEKWGGVAQRVSVASALAWYSVAALSA